MSPYERLNITPDASADEIKRAYFRMVKAFSPEKHPEAFMQIRKAYDLLSDEQKRAEYDEDASQFVNTPGEIKNLIMEATAFYNRKLQADAIRLLTESKHKNHHEVQLALCELYAEMGKIGFAVNTIEGLLAKEKENPQFLRTAVYIYIKRGWTKKAHNTAVELLRIEPHNEDNSFMHLFQKEPEGLRQLGAEIEQIAKHGGKAPMLCNLAFIRSFFGQERAEPQQLTLETLDKEPPPSPWCDPLYAVQQLTAHVTEGLSNEKKEVLNNSANNWLREIYFNDRFDLMPYVQKILTIIKPDKRFNWPFYKTAAVGYEAYEAVKNGLPKALAALFVMTVWKKEPCVNKGDQIEYDEEAFCLELDMLMHADYFIPFLDTMKDTPLYEANASFYDALSASSPTKREMQIKQKIPRAIKITNRFEFAWLGDGDIIPPEVQVPHEKQEPVRVTKIGRNEPCPCGSGKKYKKCCG